MLPVHLHWGYKDVTIGPEFGHDWDVSRYTVTGEDRVLLDAPTRGKIRCYHVHIPYTGDVRV